MMDSGGSQKPLHALFVQFGADHESEGFHFLGVDFGSDLPDQVTDGQFWQQDGVVPEAGAILVKGITGEWWYQFGLNRDGRVNGGVWHFGGPLPFHAAGLAAVRGRLLVGFGNKGAATSLPIY